MFQYGCAAENEDLDDMEYGDERVDLESDIGDYDSEEDDEEEAEGHHPDRGTNDAEHQPRSR